MSNSSRNSGIGIVTASSSQERSKGQLHIYDGEGKGKSQAALGVVLRTIGLGICEKKQTRVLLLRFLKGPGRAYDEDAAIDALQSCLLYTSPSPRDIRRSRMPSSA